MVCWSPDANEHQAPSSERAECEWNGRYGVWWQLDTSAASCCLCTSSFSLLRRRHHCRFCGSVVCDSCAEVRAVHPRSRTQERMCSACDDRGSFKSVERATINSESLSKSSDSNQSEDIRQTSKLVVGVRRESPGEAAVANSPAGLSHEHAQPPTPPHCGLQQPATRMDRMIAAQDSTGSSWLLRRLEGEGESKQGNKPANAHIMSNARAEVSRAARRNSCQDELARKEARKQAAENAARFIVAQKEAARIRVVEAVIAG